MEGHPTSSYNCEQQIHPQHVQSPARMDEKEIDQLDSEYGDAEEYEDNPDVFRIRLVMKKLVVWLKHH